MEETLVCRFSLQLEMTAQLYGVLFDLLGEVFASKKFIHYDIDDDLFEQGYVSLEVHNVDVSVNKSRRQIFEGINSFVEKLETIWEDQVLVENINFYVFEDIDDGFICLDCSRHTADIDEYYMVHNEVWYKVNPGGKGMLCIECLEKRLGRELNKDDFTDAPINHGAFVQSDLLISRLAKPNPVLASEILGC
jgi:hypothetical protein